MKYTDNTTLNDFNYCTEIFGERPSKMVLDLKFVPLKFKGYIDEITEKVVDSLMEISEDEIGTIVNEKKLVLIENNVYVSFTHLNKIEEDGYIGNVIFYFKVDDSEAATKHLTQLEECLTEKVIIEDKVTCASILGTDINLIPIDLMKADYENIDYYYNEETIKSYKKLIKKINKTDKGLSIIYGKKGTGKTVLLHHISNTIEKPSIFIPISMVDYFLSNIIFLKSLTEKYLLIIDDCDFLMSDSMYSKSDFINSSIIQLIDGFCSDDLSLNILMCFNIEEENSIEDELLECNNLLSIIEVGNLLKNKANKLSKHLWFDKINEDSCLIDILKKKENKNVTEIGYK